MSMDFDPYYKWLGIPPKDQPPHYYRLLGLELFETDPEVIAIAADQRMMHVRTFQSGENVVLSQKLQKKIAAAKACLLDPAKKSEYDISLRLQLRLQPPVPTPSLAPPPPPTPGKYPVPPPIFQTTPAHTNDADENTNPFVALKESFNLLFVFLRRHKKTCSLIAKLAGAAAVLIIVITIMPHAGKFWTFVQDKVPYLLASSEKPPERQVKVRTIPGINRERQADLVAKQGGGIPAAVEPEKKSTSSDKGGVSRPVAPPPDVEPAQASPATTPATAPADSGAANGLVMNTPSPPPTTVPGQPPDKLPSTAAEITSLKLPSGKTFKTRLFHVNASDIYDLLTDSAKEEEVIFLYYPDGPVYAVAGHEKGVLNGACMAFSDQRQPMTFAYYADGLRDGMLKIWNETGQRLYWCQYERGVRHGFCCYFKNNLLRLVLEIDQDTIMGVHLCAGGVLEKSFPPLDQAVADPDAQQLLEEVADLEADIKSNEVIFKKQIKDEEQRLRREKTGMLSAQKRAAIQDRLNQRALESQTLLINLRKFPNL